MEQRPPDTCPFRRPFDDGFRDCPAYQPAQFVPLDTSYRPLQPVWTCDHLESAHVAVQRHRIYARCRIGDAAARQAWVERQRPPRLVELRALRDEINPLIAEHVGAMWAAKADQLRAPAGTPDWLEATARLRTHGDAFLRTLEQFLEDNAARLRALGFPLGPSLQLYSELVETWVQQASSGVPEIPDAALAAFPDEVRLFFKPTYAGG